MTEITKGIFGINHWRRRARSRSLGLDEPCAGPTGTAAVGTPGAGRNRARSRRQVIASIKKVPQSQQKGRGATFRIQGRPRRRSTGRTRPN
jgi:hypothetical protein